MRRSIPTTFRIARRDAQALAEAPPTAPVIAASLGVSRQGAQKQLDLLAGDGLVGRIDNPGHARSPLYALTRRGESVLSKVDAHLEARALDFAVAMNPGDSEAALRFLAALMGQLAQDLAGRRP